MDLVIASDLHIRSSRPISRVDDYIKAQETKLRFIFDLCQREQVPLVVGGDFGDKSQWSNNLLSWFLNIIYDYDIEIYTVLGQHDLPQHRLDKWRNSGLGILDLIGVVKVLTKPVYFDNFILIGSSWGERILKAKNKKDRKEVLVIHRMIIKGEKLYPDQDDPQASTFMKKFNNFDLIISGDNHKTFTHKVDGRILVNAGSMMRQTAGQIDHEPTVFSWDCKTNKVKAIELPVEPDVIDRSHIDNIEERDSRIKAFVERLSKRENITFNYEENIENFLRDNKISKSIKNKVWEALSDE